MVLESMTDPFKAESHQKRMFFYGFGFTTIAIFLSYWIFKSQASLVMVFLASMAMIPLMYKTIVQEESKDLDGQDEKWLLKEHWKALSFFMWMFIGVTVASAFWYVLLPAKQTAALFLTQTNTLNSINGSASDALTIAASNFGKIFFNNVKVLIFCVLFSFVYGAGAIFILNWNATVVGAAIGNFVRSSLASYAHMAGLEKISAYFQVIAIGLMRYVIHGIPEILAYFAAGLSGGIISVAVIKHDYKTRKFEHILLDSADLLLISIALLFAAAILEVFVTPAIFG